MKNSSNGQKNKSGGFFTLETLGMTLMLFSAVSIILLLLSDILFGSQWFYTKFLFGTFGYFSFALLTVLCYVGIMTVLGKKRRADWKKVTLIVFLFVFLMCLVHALTAMDSKGSFSAYIVDCFKRGEGGLNTSTAGGVLFALPVYPVLRYLTPIGCYVIFPLLAVVDIFILYRVSVASAVKRATGKNKIKAKEISGYKDYSDMDFDFSAPPQQQRVSNGLYHGDGTGEFTEATKKDKKAEKDRALELLFPENYNERMYRNPSPNTYNYNNNSYNRPQSFDRGRDNSPLYPSQFDDRQQRYSSTPTDRQARNPQQPVDRQPTSRQNDRLDLNDFGGQSYQRQMDRDIEMGENKVRTPSPVERKDDFIPFDRNSSVTERRGVEFRDDRVPPLPTPQNDTGRFDSFDFNRPIGRDNSTGRTDDNDTTRRFIPLPEDPINEQNNNSRNDDFSRLPFAFDDERAFERESSEDEFPFENELPRANVRTTRGVNGNSWATLPKKKDETVSDKQEKNSAPIVPDLPKPNAPISEENPLPIKEDNPTEEIKPTNTSRFNFQPEKKSIYIESDTSEVVMPEDEKPKKKKTDESAEAEQVPIVEKLEYIGIPEMPLKYRYNAPPIALYKDNPKKADVYDDSVEERCRIIEKTLENFNVPAHVENVIKGPTITRYEISIPEGITVSKVPPRASDLAMRLEVESVRIEAPIPGKNLIGIEVPNKVKEMVGMKELLLEKDFQKSPPEALSIVLGEDVVGNPVITDLTKTPHLLVAGATGMGKSVFLNSMIMSLVTKYGPEDLRLVLVDPKQVEFSIFENLPHLLINQIITEASLCIGILDWAIDEMEERYRIFRSCYAQKIDEYNHAINPKTQRKMPKIVIIIDELGDLFSISAQIKHDIEDRIKRLTQKARAAGIHVVVATQRPDVTVITGVIKTNLPSRVAFKVLNYADSNTILSDGGAERLLGNGDMIFKTSNSALLKRIQGSYVSKEEMLRVLAYIRDNNACYFDNNAKKYLDAKKASTQNGGFAASASFGDNSDTGEADDTFNGIPLRNLRALRLSIEKKQASISSLQRSMSIGYSTAGRIIDWMEKMNYISPYEGSKARSVTISMEEFENLYGEANLD